MSEKIKSIYYQAGKENKEYWKLLDELKEKGDIIEGNWNGDYFVTVYEMGKYRYYVWENIEYGIQSEIEKYEME